MSSSSLADCDQPEIKTLKRRWWILFIFTAILTFQTCIWNTWPPISQSVKGVYPNFTDGSIAFLNNWGPISVLIFLPACSWIVKKNLRYAMMLAATMMCFSTGIRCIPMIRALSDTSYLAIAHISALVNGIAGGITRTAPPVVSAAWFPPHQRTFATTSSIMIGGLGAGCSFLLASEIVTTVPNSNTTNFRNETSNDIKEAKHEINLLMLIYFAITAFFMLSVLLYFPSKAPHPPSITSTIERLDFKQGLSKLLKNRNVWLVTFALCSPGAVTGMWADVITLFLPNMCFDNECLTSVWVNRLGLICEIVSTVVNVIIASMTEYFKGRFKWMMITLLSVSGTFFVFFSLVLLEVLTFSNIFGLKVALYFLMIIPNAIISACMPIAYEYCSELAYPVPEAVVGGFVNYGFNSFCLIFLGLFNIPGIGEDWLNYVCPITVFLAVPVVLAVKDSFNRRIIDSEIGGISNPNYEY